MQNIIIVGKKLHLGLPTQKYKTIQEKINFKLAESNKNDKIAQTELILISINRQQKIDLKRLSLGTLLRVGIENVETVRSLFFFFFG